MAWNITSRQKQTATEPVATRVRVALLVGTIALAALIAVATVAIIWSDRERDLQSAERELSRLSLTLAESTSQTMQSLDLVLIGILEGIASAGISTPELLRQRFSGDAVRDMLIERKQDISQLDAIVVVGDDGRVVNSTRIPAVPPTFNFSDRDYFIAHKASDDLGVYIGAPVPNRVTGEWTFFLTRRINGANGEFVGALNAVIRTQFIENLFDAVAPGTNATISLFRRDGVLLARHPRSDAFIGRSFGAQPLFTETMARSDAGVVRTPASAFDSISRVMTPNSVRGYPLIINVTNTTEAILEAWRQRATMTASAAAAAGFLIVILGFLFGRQFDLRLQMAKTIASQEEAARSERQIRELAENLEQSLRQMRAVTDHLPVLIAYVDRELKIRFINRTGEIWFACKRADIIGVPISEILGRPPTNRPDDLFARLAKGPVHDVRKRQQPDGVVRTLDVLNVPDIGPEGSVLGYYALLTDITERVATEEQLRQAQKLDAIGKLTGGIAHDFNNLLAVTLGHLEMAKDSLGDRHAAVASIDIALRATEQGAELTRSLLSFARQQSLTPKPTDLGKLVDEMIGLMRRTLPENILIETSSSTDLWLCHVDPAQTKNALLNLVLNARDAMPDGGRLMIESANVCFADEEATGDSPIAAGQYVMLAVSDNGSGMPPEVAAQAFEPFFTTKEAGRGTGLGLSMVYGFAKQSGGNIKIYSEVGHGTSVKLYLPRSEAHAFADEATEAQQPRTAGPDETLLVVEDNPDVRLLTSSMLRSLGYEVLDCETPREALETLRGRPDIRLLLSDMVLSDSMNGPQLAEAALAERPNLKIVFMSGYTENALKHGDIGGRPMRLLSKPFRKQALAQIIRESLDGA